VVLKVRDARGKVRRRVVLVAYGVTPAGRREVLADAGEAKELLSAADYEKYIGAE